MARAFFALWAKKELGPFDNLDNQKTADIIVKRGWEAETPVEAVGSLRFSRVLGAGDTDMSNRLD